MCLLVFVYPLLLLLTQSFINIILSPCGVFFSCPDSLTLWSAAGIDKSLILHLIAEVMESHKLGYEEEVMYSDDDSFSSGTSAAVGNLLHSTSPMPLEDSPSPCGTSSSSVAGDLHR